MKLKEILAISGQSGLYKFVAQSKNGIIVEQLGSGVRSCASASAKVSSLGEIAIFTENDDVPLAQVFQQIYDKHAGQPVLSHKSAPEDLKKFFAEALPEYDRDRVHVSDIKKVALWYNLLLEAGMTDFKDDEQSDGKTQDAEYNRCFRSETPDVLRKSNGKRAPRRLFYPSRGSLAIR